MDEHRLSEMSEAAAHATRRFELYKARTYGPRPTSPERLKTLKRDADRAKLALHRARAND